MVLDFLLEDVPPIYPSLWPDLLGEEQKLAALSADLREHIGYIIRMFRDEEFEAWQEPYRAYHNARELELRAEHAKAVRLRQGRVGA